MEIKGVNFSIWDEKGFYCTSTQMDDYVSKIVEMGSNTVFINYHYAYDIVTGNRVYDAYPVWGTNQNSSISAVESAIQKFKSAGLDVVLSPHTNAWNSSTNTGAGNINIWNTDVKKLDVGNFFVNYERQVLEAAQLSQKYSLPILNVGVEMNCLDQKPYTEFWSKIIDDVRHIYSGKLTYSGLTNIYGEADATGVEFYSKLDYTGLTLYPFLGHDDPNASVDELFQSAYDTKFTYASKAGGWEAYLSDLKEKFDKPLLLIETGFTSMDGGATTFLRPSLLKSIDYQEQSDALFAWLSFLGNLPANEIAGLGIWEVAPVSLYVTDGNGGFIGMPQQLEQFQQWYQRSYEFIGKPAEFTISEIFHASNSSQNLHGLTLSTQPNSLSLKGTFGSDILLVGEGNHTIDGGMGVDIAKFSQTYNKVDLVKSSQANTYVGSDAFKNYLSNVERLQFSDIAIALDTGKGESGGEAYRLYKAAFDRTPDKGGLGYWIDAFDHGAELTEVASAFIASPEFSAMYGANSTDTNFVTLLYNHVLHRDPDAEGNAYWLNALHNGMTRGAVLASFSESPENIAQTAPLIANGIQYHEWVG